MIEPTFKVSPEHYNSGTAFTGMTVDGEEVTDAKASFSSAWCELIHSVDATEELFAFELPMDVEEEVGAISHEVLSHTTSHAKALVLLTPSLAEKEPHSIKEAMKQTEQTLNEESLALADVFYEELRFGIRKQAREQFEQLMTPSFSNVRLDALNSSIEAQGKINAAFIETDTSISSMPIADLLRMQNPEINHRFSLLDFRHASFGTCLCITMALAYFSSLGAQVALTNEGKVLKMKIKTKN